MATIIVLSILVSQVTVETIGLVEDSEAKKLEKTTSKKNCGDYLNG
jgi:hypothetical protein